jgi:hypothetical protein
LRNEVDTSEFKMGPKAYTWLLLKAIEKEYPDVYNRSVTNIDKLTWEMVTAELQQIAVSESIQPAMSSVKFNTPKNNGGNNSDNKTVEHSSDNTTNKKREKCKDCTKIVNSNSKHCPRCNGHPPKNADCWWCEPEKAPEDWPPKSKAIEAKKRRQSSTTGPLHQQSGVENADNNKGKKNPSSLLFITNDGDETQPSGSFTNLQHFHQGPRYY